MEDTNDSFLSANSKEKVKWICTAWDRWIWSEKEGDPEFLGMSLDTIFVNFPGLFGMFVGQFEGRNFSSPPIENIITIKFRWEAAIRRRRQYSQL